MRVWAAVLLGGAPTLAGAQSAFGPTEDYRIPLAPCERTLDTRQVHPPLGTVDLFRGDARLRITMVGVDNYKAQAFAGALPRSPDVTVRVQATTPGDVSEHGYCHDLNRDGSTDFAVALWRHGNGLGASFYDWLIALSSGDSY
ncbi:MAG TPA: hypothetical protein VFB99_01770 [Vicinamibacterales bacterium]|nr:hypothetical protein [Vicinamibacterales bacterium]